MIQQIATEIRETYDPEYYECFPCFCVQAREYVDWLYNVGIEYANTKYEHIPLMMRELLMELVDTHTEGYVKSAIDSLSQQYFLDHAENFTS